MRGQGLVEYALIGVLIAVVVIVVLSLVFLPNNVDSRLDKYEAVLSRCLERETISREECEAIARQEAFGSSGNTTVVIPQGQ